LIQARRFHHQHREWRGIFEVRTELRHGLVPVFLAELLDCLRILEENHLCGESMGSGLRLFERRLRLSALCRITRTAQVRDASARISRSIVFGRRREDTFFP